MTPYDAYREEVESHYDIALEMYTYLSCKEEHETASSLTLIFSAIFWDEFVQEVERGISLRSPA